MDSRDVVSLQLRMTEVVGDLVARSVCKTNMLRSEKYLSVELEIE